MIKLEFVLLSLMIISTLAAGWVSLFGLMPLYSFFLVFALVVGFINRRVSYFFLYTALACLLFVGLVLLSGGEGSVSFAANILSGVAISYIAYIVIRSDFRYFFQLYKSILLVQTIALFVGFFQSFFNIGFFLDTQYVSETGGASPAGLSSMQYAFARNFFPLVSIFLAYLFLRMRGLRFDKKLERLVILSGLVGGLGIAVSNSRSAMIGTFMVSLGFAIWNVGLLRLLKSKYFLFFMAVALVSLLLMLQAKPMFENGEANYNTFSRFYLWGATLQVFLENPILGVGAGEIRGALDRVLGSSSTSVVERMPHNIYFQLLAETGLVGTVLFFAPFVLAVRAVFNQLSKTKEPYRRLMYSAIGVYFFIFAIDSTFHNHLNDNLYWLFLGAAIAAISPKFKYYNAQLTQNCRRGE